MIVERLLSFPSLFVSHVCNGCVGVLQTFPVFCVQDFFAFVHRSPDIKISINLILGIVFSFPFPLCLNWDNSGFVRMTPVPVCVSFSMGIPSFLIHFKLQKQGYMDYRSVFYIM